MEWRYTDTIWIGSKITGEEKMKVIHVDPEVIRLDIEAFIKEHFWQTKQEFFEHSGEKTPKEYKYYDIEIIIKELK